MEMASFFIKIHHVLGDTSLTERCLGAGPPVIIQLSGYDQSVFRSGPRTPPIYEFDMPCCPNSPWPGMVYIRPQILM
jgi:hypothetical protein